MKTFRLEIEVLTAMGSALGGTQLFGQLCCAIRDRFGSETLTKLLEGYEDQKPFLVISDAFPKGHIPLATMPNSMMNIDEKTDRKIVKKLKWIPLESIHEELPNWFKFAKSDKDLCNEKVISLMKNIQVHNTLNRLTQTTGVAPFTPYETTLTHYSDNALLDIYIVLDTDRFSLDNLKTVLNDIGTYGFGRDSSIGLGKFSVNTIDEVDVSKTQNQMYETLAVSSLKGVPLDTSNSFYKTETYFGKHGSIRGLINSPFKSPVLLASTGALLKLKTSETTLFIGNGIKGVSPQYPDTVQQGYAPVIGL